MDDTLLDIISNLPPLAQNIIYALIAGGALWALWDRTIGRFVLKIWPDRKTWTAICLPWQEGDPNREGELLDPNRPLHFPGLRWCQMRNMRKGDYYQVDMQKDRLISRLCLVCREKRYPKKYRIEVANNDAIDSFKDLGEPAGPIDYRFSKPQKFRVVKFTITEPDILPNNAPHSWCIYDVRFYEVRIPKIWNPEIKA